MTVTGVVWAARPLTAVTTLWAWVSLVSWKVIEPCWLITVCRLAPVTARTVTVRVTLRRAAVLVGGAQGDGVGAGRGVDVAEATPLPLPAVAATVWLAEPSPQLIL